MEDRYRWLGLLLALVAVGAVLAFAMRHQAASEQRQDQSLFSAYLIDESTGDESLDARLNFLRSAHGVVEDAFPYLNIKESHFGYDWDAVLAYYEPRVRGRDQSETAFLFTVSEMLSLLDDPGTRLAERNLGGVEKTLLINIDRNEDGLYLKNYHAAYRSNEEFMEMMEPGDRLLRIDERNATELYDVLLQDSIFGRYPRTEELFTRRFFRTYYHQALEGIRPQHSRLEFEKEDGTQYTLTLAWQDAMQVSGIHGVVISAADNRSTYGEYIEENNLAYIRLNSLYLENLPLFQSEMARMQNTDGLILDLRGADRSIDYTTFERAILGYFVDRKTTLFYRKTRFSAFLLAADNEFEPVDTDYYPAMSVEIDPAASRYRAPVVVLIDEDYMESPDELIVGLRELADATLIGRGFEIHVLGRSIPVDTPFSEYGLRVSTAYLYDRSLRKLENERIEVDIEVPIRADEASGRLDPLLAEAIAWFESEAN